MVLRASCLSSFISGSRQLIHYPPKGTGERLIRRGISPETCSVRKEGVEPSRPKTHDPESCVAAITPLALDLFVVRPLAFVGTLDEPMTGVEPAWRAWEARILAVELHRPATRRHEIPSHFRVTGGDCNLRACPGEDAVPRRAV